MARRFCLKYVNDSEGRMVRPYAFFMPEKVATAPHFALIYFYDIFI